MTDADRTEPEQTPFWKRLARISVMSVVGLSFVGATAAGIGALHFRAAAEIPAAANPPLSVAVQPAKLQDGYDVVQRFAGRLEPKRRTRLSFERGGLVTSIAFDEGEVIEKGAVIARLDTAKLDAERARLQAQRRELDARLALARLTLERQDDLMKKGFRSAQRHDEARFQVEELKAAIDANAAAIRSVNVDISKAVLYAPFGGTAAGRMIDEGTVVSAGTAVIDLLEAGAPTVRVGIAVDASKALVVGKSYTLAVGGETFDGTLTALRPDIATGTRTAIALFDAPSAGFARFGEIVELVLEKKVSSPGYWLPSSALSEGRKGLWSVFVVDHRDGTETTARESVEVLHSAGDRVFVRGTLRDGAMVITNGTNRIVPGQTVAASGTEHQS